MDFKLVGDVDGSPIYRRGEWYFARNPEGKWCKILFDWKTGVQLTAVLDKDLAGLGEAPKEVIKDAVVIEPL